MKNCSQERNSKKHLSNLNNQRQLIKCLSVEYRIYRKDQNFFLLRLLEKIYSLIMPFCLMRHNKSFTKQKKFGEDARTQNFTRSSFINKTILNLRDASFSNFLSYKQPTISESQLNANVWKWHIHTHIQIYNLHSSDFKYKLMWT